MAANLKGISRAAKKQRKRARSDRHGLRKWKKKEMKFFVKEKKAEETKKKVIKTVDLSIAKAKKADKAAKAATAKAKKQKKQEAKGKAGKAIAKQANKKVRKDQILKNAA